LPNAEELILGLVALQEEEETPTPRKGGQSWRGQPSPGKAVLTTKQGLLSQATQGSSAAET